MKDFESIGKMIEHFVIERNKQVDGAILGEIIEIAKENEMYKTIYLNEKEIIKALREYMEKQNPKTNYERIKSMSVEEMAGLIVDFHFVFQCKSYGLDPKTTYENMNEEDKKKNKEWEEEMRPIWERWLLQEVNEND